MKIQCGYVYGWEFVWCVGICMGGNVYGMWCMVCGMWCVVCGVWCVVCGMWCVCLCMFMCVCVCLKNHKECIYFYKLD